MLAAQLICKLNVRLSSHNLVLKFVFIYLFIDYFIKTKVVVYISKYIKNKMTALLE